MLQVQLQMERNETGPDECQTLARKVLEFSFECHGALVRTVVPHEKRSYRG